MRQIVGIRKGAHGKPMWAKFKTSAETGVLTVKVPADHALAHANGYFTVGHDGLVHRTIMKNGKPQVEILKVDKPFWKMEPGQVIAKDGKPVVGDYDLLGVAPIKSPGRNINVVPEDAAYGDWKGPDVAKYQKAVNKSNGRTARAARGTRRLRRQSQIHGPDRRHRVCGLP
jgi:hypothetical protein